MTVQYILLGILILGALGGLVVFFFVWDGTISTHTETYTTIYQSRFSEDEDTL